MKTILKNIKKINKIGQIILLLAIIGGLVFYFEADIKQALYNADKIVNPCGQPIAYSIGNFDKRFNLSQQDFLSAINQAAQIWEKPVNKKLFSLAANGGLKVNLIYDSRQAATDQLKTLGIVIHSDKATYETLKDKYSAFDKIYQTQKAELDNMVSYYDELKANYEDEVKAANKRGGVSPDEFAILEQERNDLNKLAESIKRKQETLNKTVEDVNALASAINKLIRELNLNVGDYNAIGSQSAGEFQEGVYISDASGEKINIYQFDDRQALIRVLAHELGHALGLEHLDNPQAIMYRLNESGNDKITADDLAALKLACKIK